jgi:hypothetical protein
MSASSTFRSFRNSASGELSCKQSDHGLVVRSLCHEERHRQHREKASLHVLEWTNPPQMTKEMAESLMNNPQQKLLQGRSLAACAVEVGGVHISWSCGSPSEHQLCREELQFICDKKKNPIIKWNPNHLPFEDNTCRLHERNDHGLEHLDRTPGCEFLGIQSFCLTDDQFPSCNDCCRLEHSFQLKIDHLELGTQRMQIISGSGSRDLCDGPVRMVVLGATILPPIFWNCTKRL